MKVSGDTNNLFFIVRTNKMSSLFAKYFGDTNKVLKLLGVILLVSALVWLIKKLASSHVAPPVDANTTSKAPADTGTTAVKGGAQISHRAYGVPDAGPNGASGPNAPDMLMPKTAFSPSGNVRHAPTNIDLAAPFPRSGSATEQFIFNTQDVLIDPRVQHQWSLMEMQKQQNLTQDRNGEIWLKNWDNLGPLPPLAPNGKPGTQDPQLSYGLSIASALDQQSQKFQVKENLNDISYAYRNQLQQLPGSRFEVFEASFDPYKTPQVIDRFSQLALSSAQWVVSRLNEKIRKDHPCFSLAQKEHFEQTNPPLACQDQSGPFMNPIVLIRVFECRVQRLKEDESQKVYLTMEIGNQISAGSGGMYSTIVTINNRGQFVDYEDFDRDDKQTFVLPRTRTDAT